MSFLVSALAATREQAKTATNKVICFMDNIVTVWSGRQLMQSFCRKRKSKSKNPADYNPLFFLSSLWARSSFKQLTISLEYQPQPSKGPLFDGDEPIDCPADSDGCDFLSPSLSLFLSLSLSLSFQK